MRSYLNTIKTLPRYLVAMIGYKQRGGISMGLTSDLILWGLVLIIAGFWSYYQFIVAPRLKQQTVRIAFADANEITKGATVHMMGTDVGYVDTVKLDGDHVNVTIKTYPNTVAIPSGSIFTIKFTGLVGAKSIEIITPEVPRPKRNGKPHYYLENPIRMKDTLNYQINIAQALQRGAENFSDFFGKKKPLEEVIYNIREQNSHSDEVIASLDHFNNKLKETRLDFGQDIHQVANTMENFSYVVAQGRTLTDTNALGPQIYHGVSSTLLSLVDSHASLIQFQVENQFHKMNKQNLALSQGMVNASHGILSPRIHHEMMESRTILTNLNTSLTQAVTYLEANTALTQLSSIQKTIQGFNAKLLSLMDRFNIPSNHTGEQS